MEKMAQTCQISKNFFFTLPYFYDKFHWVAKNLEGFCFSPTFKSSMWPVLAKLLSGWLPLWLHHKILKRNPVSGSSPLGPFSWERLHAGALHYRSKIQIIVNIKLINV
jgi:hypothetical protein